MTTTSAAPAKPIELKPIAVENLFILWHRKGNDPRPAPLYFSFEGSFDDAIKRGRRFCEETGIKFVYVKRFVTDLEEATSKVKSGYAF